MSIPAWSCRRHGLASQDRTMQQSHHAGVPPGHRTGQSITLAVRGMVQVLQGPHDASTCFHQNKTMACFRS
jgi:hypothetical protein